MGCVMKINELHTVYFIGRSIVREESSQMGRTLRTIIERSARGLFLCLPLQACRSTRTEYNFGSHLGVALEKK